MIINNQQVLWRRLPSGLSIILNRPESINSLSEAMIDSLLDFHIPARPAMDAWVERYFSGKVNISDILASLSKCREQEEYCNEVFASIAERSPTALVLTLKLLRYNEGRSIADVLATELKAAQFITRHSDYIEGIRARLVDRDDKPKWQPDRIELVDPSGFLP